MWLDDDRRRVQVCFSTLLPIRIIIRTLSRPVKLYSIFGFLTFQVASSKFEVASKRKQVFLLLVKLLVSKYILLSDYIK